MLKALDVIIGFSTIILLFSLAVSALVQGVTGILNTRGGHLRDGIARLLKQLDPTLEADMLKKIATCMLCHPLISYNPRRLGDVIQRNEFTRLLLQFAAGEGAASVPPEVQQKVLAMVKVNGVSDPSDVLTKLRDLALQLEQSQPKLSTSERESMAIISIAPTALVAKIHGWFDETIDRISASFTANIRLYTLAASVLVVLVVQLNSIAMINRLSLDDAFRARAVAVAQALPPPAAGQTSSDLAAAMQWSGLLGVPVDGGFTKYFAWWGTSFSTNCLGMLLSVLFLSFGAPFWYNALKNLLQLRSALTQKDDAQRASRQSNAAAAPGGSPV